MNSSGQDHHVVKNLGPFISMKTNARGSYNTMLQQTTMIKMIMCFHLFGFPFLEQIPAARLQKSGHYHTAELDKHPCLGLSTYYRPVSVGWVWFIS